MNDQALKYIIDLLNIKVESDFAILEVKAELEAAADAKDLVEFIRDNMNVQGYEYMTGFQKFVAIAKKFKKQQAELMKSALLKDGEARSYLLAQKVKAVDTLVLNNQSNNPQWECFKVDGELFFNAKEISTLSRIGSPLTCVKLQRMVSGRDLLAERLESLYMEIKTHLIESKKSSPIVASLAESVRV